MEFVGRSVVYTEHKRLPFEKFERLRYAARCMYPSDFIFTIGEL